MDNNVLMLGKLLDVQKRRKADEPSLTGLFPKSGKGVSASTETKVAPKDGPVLLSQADRKDHACASKTSEPLVKTRLRRKRLTAGGKDASTTRAQGTLMGDKTTVMPDYFEFTQDTPSDMPEDLAQIVALALNASSAARAV